MLQFTKMHGLGNDFMVVDGISQRFDLSNDELMRLANRKTGIGFDQLLLVEPPTRADVYLANGSSIRSRSPNNSLNCAFTFMLVPVFVYIKSYILTEVDVYWIVNHLRQNDLPHCHRPRPA